MAEKFYVTTPIYYVNARPHIGHAYTTIVADVLARRHRLLGEDVWFLTGTDEHGQKIERSAAVAGVPPQQFADEVSGTFASLWKRMGITNDQYIRTTDDAHKRGVQKLFSELYAEGKIYLSTYTGQYSIGEEMFVEGPPGTIGPDGKPTETVTEENFFFRLSEYQLRLLNLIESDELRIAPESRKNEVLSFLRGNISGLLTDYARDNDLAYIAGTEAVDGIIPAGSSGTIEATYLLRENVVGTTTKGTPYVIGALKDLSVSRSSFTWGIPVPEPAASEAKEKHVIYVWLDALANYITALGYGSEDESQFDKFWPADLHLVGKEIIRFHCVYWPAFLMAAGLKLPKAITAHGWLLFDDAKMSKSKGNVVRSETILDAFGALCPPAEGVPQGLKPGSVAGEDRTAEAVRLAGEDEVEDRKRRDLFAADVLRYFLLREIPFGQDGSFSFEAMVTRYNADLANGYGNLVSRTLSLIAKTSGGVVEDSPEAHSLVHWEPGMGEQIGASEGQLLGWRATELIAKMSISLDDNAYAEALQRWNALLTAVDQFITSRKPWAATDSEYSQHGRRQTLYTAAECIRILTALIYPVLPDSSAKVWRQLGLGDMGEAAARGELQDLQWGGLRPGTKLGQLGPVFPRAEKGLAKTMSELEAATATGQTTMETNERTAGTEFQETLPVSEANLAPTENVPASDPAAGPRTASLAEPNPGGLVAGSAAVTTERPGTPGHAEAASGIFAAAAPTSAGPADASPQITIDDFAKVELRVAKVLVCERIPKADKLLRLEVDLGYEQRQILSGIAEWYTPEDLIGRRIVVITNLAPRKMRGLESHGMLLAGSADGGKPALATFADSDELPLGSRLK